MELSLRAHGPAPAEVVWTRYTRPSLWATWAPQISSVECADDTIRVGSTGTVHALFGVRVTFEVTDFDPDGRRWAWVARLPVGIDLRLRHTVTGVPDGARTDLRLSGFTPVVLGYAPIASLALRRLVSAEPATGTR